MTEFWVSQPKHYCKFCKVWLANNKPSIQHHEMGKKHKEMVEAFFTEKREARLQGAMSESDLDKQLREIDKAAREQAEKDAELFGGVKLPKAAPPPPPRPAGMTGRPLQPPPPPRRDPTAGYKKGEEEVKELEKEEEDDGCYTVDGITYLDGKKHESKIIKGMLCEIWVEAEDRWVENALILSVREVAVPNTTMVLRKINVLYKLNPEDDEPRMEEEVTSDRIRLLEDVKEPEAPEPPPKDERTGFGGWQTVAVRVVDEEAERRAAQEAIVMAELERKEADGKKRMQLMQEAMEGEDAMSSYDPHGKGVYKGIDLSTTTTITAADIDLGGDTDGPVAFKKRKLAAGKAKFRRKKDDDDE